MTTVKNYFLNLINLGLNNTKETEVKFKTLNLNDKQVFDKFSQESGVFSDFNFNSFYSWDTDSNHQWCILKNNLVLKISDYVTGAPFMSILGQNDIDETLKTLIKYSKANGMGTALKLIPATTIDSIKNKNEFLIIEDKDNFDHIFSIEDLAYLRGRKYKSKRHAAAKCENNYTIYFEDFSQKTDNIESEIFNLLNEWEAEKNESGKEVDMGYEYVAIERILKNITKQDGLILTVAKENGATVGFSIDELLTHKTVMSHYFKTLPHINGLSELLNKKIAEKLLQLGYRYWNWEQDLGIESLQRMKLSYRPIDYRKKYIVKQK